MPVFGMAHPAMTVTIDKAVLSSGAGIGTGAGQAGLTAMMDAGPSPPANFLNPLTDTGGQAINVVTGGGALGLGLLGAFGRGPLKAHPTATAGIVGYGATALLVGWLVPKVIKMTAPSGNAGNAANIAAAQARARAAAAAQGRPVSAGGATAEELFGS